jgi:hypothetical protein
MRRSPTQRTNAGSVTTGSTATAPTSGTSSNGSASSDPAAVAAAAQTSDGRAIPQPAAPNGQCPEVLVAYGFWSCPNLNEECTLPSGSRCTCLPSSGEGQAFSWICN